MRFTSLIFSFFLLFSFEIKAQNNTPLTYTYRTNGSVERLIATLDNMGEPQTMQYQGTKDLKPVKLTILKRDTENMRIITQRTDNKKKLTFSTSWLMGGTLYDEKGESKTFMQEIACVAPTGEVILTSGGPMFLPFFFANNIKGKFTSLEISQDQIANDTQKLPTGESYYEVDVPLKKGKYKIAPMPYDEQEGNITKIKMVSPDGKITIFKSKKM